MRRGGTNVFQDLGFSAKESANLLLRSNLMILLRNRLDALALTQAEAAVLLSVTQPRVSDLVRGKIDRFSVDTLVLMLGKAGFDIRLSVHTAD